MFKSSLCLQSSMIISFQDSILTSHFCILCLISRNLHPQFVSVPQNFKLIHLRGSLNLCLNLTLFYDPFFCLPHSLLLILNFRSIGITSNTPHCIILFTFLIIILPTYLTDYLAKQILFILFMISKIIFSQLYAFSVE